MEVISTVGQYAPTIEAIFFLGTFFKCIHLHTMMAVISCLPYNLNQRTNIGPQGVGDVLDYNFQVFFPLIDEALNSIEQPGTEPRDTS